MDIRGLVLINSESETGTEANHFGGTPLGLLDVAGKSALMRTAERLRKSGVGPVTAVIEDVIAAPGRGLSQGEPGLTSVFSPRDRFWRTAENAFNDLVQSGAEIVILIKIGTYQEADFDKVLQHHLDNNCRVSQLSHQGEPLQVFCISASRRNDAASLFRTNLSKCRIDCQLVEQNGYFNPLRNAGDLRQFAIDIVTLQTETSPAGTQVKPGVWMAPGAHVEKGARLVAPAFIGAGARVRSGAVITRCTTVERNSEIDCGTVAENSSILPNSYLGAGLDLAHSVMGMGVIANLRRGAIALISDTKLIKSTTETAAPNFLSSAKELLTFIPRQMWQGVFGSRVQQPDLSTTLHQTSPALGKAAGYEAPACNAGAADEFSNFVAVRTHGNQ
jgi:carbonic anhydrase/acetyltransferase-like protein (isoleucine patch superfamily)